MTIMLSKLCCDCMIGCDCAALDGVINCGCLLSMEAAYSKYYNCICKPCHNFCS